jgi:hypothetical protein
VAGRIRPIEHSNDLIANGARDLAASKVLSVTHGTAYTPSHDQ